jgi:hypothetical protein
MEASNPTKETKGEFTIVSIELVGHADYCNQTNVHLH